MSPILQAVQAINMLAPLVERYVRDGVEPTQEEVNSALAGLDMSIDQLKSLIDKKSGATPAAPGT